MTISLAYKSAACHYIKYDSLHLRIDKQYKNRNQKKTVALAASMLYTEIMTKRRLRIWYIMRQGREMEETMHNQNLSAAEALEKLKEGNQRYLEATANPGDISPKIRQYTCENGQSPYAIVVTCSDSRVIPEGIFSAGIGELFVIRVAGNVMDNHQLGSVEYAADHLGTKLVVVLGHSNCGAVGAALTSDPAGYVKYITDEIRKAIGDEKDEAKACCLNVQRSVSVIRESLSEMVEQGKLTVCGAVYHIDSGKVEFLD